MACTPLVTFVIMRWVLHILRIRYRSLRIKSLRLSLGVNSSNGLIQSVRLSSKYLYFKVIPNGLIESCNSGFLSHIILNLELGLIPLCWSIINSLYWNLLKIRL